MLPLINLFLIIIIKVSDLRRSQMQMFPTLYIVYIYYFFLKAYRMFFVEIFIGYYVP